MGVDGDIGAYDGYGSDGSYGSDRGGGGDYGNLGDIGGGDEGGGYSDAEGDGYGGGEGDGAGDAGVGPISLEDAFREKPQTYEDLCRSHIVSDDTCNRCFVILLPPAAPDRLDRRWRGDLAVWVSLARTLRGFGGDRCVDRLNYLENGLKDWR